MRASRTDSTSLRAVDVDVLVVDDDEAFRSSVADILRSEGMSVIEAANGIEALDHLQFSQVAVMVLDVQMPQLSGPELLDRLDDPPLVVLLTAHPLDYEIVALRPKIASYLKKPVAPQDLITLVVKLRERATRYPSHSRLDPDPVDALPLNFCEALDG